jgi:hypothetical protein
MDTQKIQYATGLQVVNFTDTHGRETEVYIGLDEIMVAHKAQDGNMESMRRYNRQEIAIILESLGNTL